MTANHLEPSRWTRTSNDEPAYSNASGFVGVRSGACPRYTATFEANPNERFPACGPCYLDEATGRVTAQPIGPEVGRVINVRSCIQHHGQQYALEVEVERSDMAPHYGQSAHGSFCYDESHHPFRACVPLVECSHANCVVQHVLET